MAWSFFANGLLIGVGAAVLLYGREAPDQFYRLVQEDGVLEWCTVWGFLLAAAAAAANAVADLRRRPRPWFLAGLAVFCTVVAMEEISWGQRLLGYRPPDYFLENNFQQELNLHNIASTSLRKLALLVVIGGYGVALPLLLRIRLLGTWAQRIGLVPPPLALLPAFAATGGLYLWYPVRFTGEVVELLLGGCFLFAMLPALVPRLRIPPAVRWTETRVVLLASLLVLGLGAASARWLVLDHAPPEVRAQARSELESLRARLRAAARAQGHAFISRCGVHKRLYAFARKYGVSALQTAAPEAAGEDAVSRASYLLDPWNSPYWIRHKCRQGGGRRAVFVYSFGPNRRRDSTAWEIRGDDLGVTIVPVGSGPAARGAGRDPIG